MSKRLERNSSRKSIASSEASPAKTSRRRAKVRGSKKESVRDSGENSTVSSKSFTRRTPSSKTSPPVRNVGCPTCGATCICWGTERVPSSYLPSTSERPTSASECSFLLPTLSASSYGTNQGGAAGRKGKVRRSLETLARQGLLPTLTVKVNYNKKGLSPRAGDGLQTAIGGKLNPRFLEWFMGFPIDFTLVEDDSDF